MRAFFDEPRQLAGFHALIFTLMCSTIRTSPPASPERSRAGILHLEYFYFFKSFKSGFIGPSHV
jgi:hypothetical protein